MQAHWIDPSMHRASMPLTILVLRQAARYSSSWTGQAADTHDRHPSHDRPGTDTHRPSQPNIPLTPAHLSTPNATPLYTYQTIPSIHPIPGQKRYSACTTPSPHTQLHTVLHPNLHIPFPPPRERYKYIPVHDDQSIELDAGV